MKKLFAIICFLVMGNSGVFAGALTATTTNFGVVAWEYIDSSTNVYRPGVNDSVIGVDTVVLFKKVTYTPGYVYALLTADSVGATDTISIEYVAYKSSGTSYITVGTGLCDTIEPQAAIGTFYRASALPIGKTAWGTHFDIKAVGWIAAKIAKIRRAYLIGGKPIYGTYEVSRPRQN